MEANKQYKDSLLRSLLNEPKKALKVYSDITGKTYPEDTVVEMMPLDTLLLSKLRNDISFLINGRLIVFLEHQSTVNHNMPLRILQYIVLFFMSFYKTGTALYAQKQIMLPRPEFYVLYNGKVQHPQKDILRLSDAFMDKSDIPPAMELIVNVININYEVLTPALQENEDIRGYAIFVDIINKGMQQGLTLSNAMKNAVEECMAKGILKEFLSQYKNEVESMFTLVYDEDMAKKIAREEGREDGLEEGLEKGLEVGLEKGLEVGIKSAALKLLKAGMNLQEVSTILELPDAITEDLIQAVYRT